MGHTGSMLICSVKYFSWKETMSDNNGIKVEPHLSLNLGKGNKSDDGGDGGSIFIITEEMKGEGKISANGGKGKNGGKGGQIHIQAKKNNFTGEISVDGGKSEK